MAGILALMAVVAAGPGTASFGLFVLAVVEASASRSLHSTPGTG